jgi:hypothetical protein
MAEIKKLMVERRLFLEIVLVRSAPRPVIRKIAGLTGPDPKSPQRFHQIARLVALARSYQLPLPTTAMASTSTRRSGLYNAGVAWVALAGTPR